MCVNATNPGGGTLRDVPCWMADDWADVMLDIIAARSEPPVPSPVRPGSLWVSKATGRRGAVLWASKGQVKLSFDETNPDAYVVHAEKDLIRLYTEAK